jgi:adenylate kinase family enzyme
MHPIAVLQVGGPFAGKTAVARSIAQMFGLKLLTPEQLVADAVAAAQAWEQQQQQQEGPQQPEPPTSSQEQQHAGELRQQQLIEDVNTAAEPPKQVLMGQQALQELQQGICVSDALLVELLVQGMLQARDYAPPLPAPPAVEVKGTKGGKGVAKAEPAGPAAKNSRGSSGGAANSAGSTAGAVASAAGSSAGSATCNALLPAHLAAAAGAQGRGFISDGFPATAEQAVLLEKALTGLELAAEQALVDEVSLVAPPPLDALPQLQRPLVSGLDAVLVLGCKDEALVAKRALGRRLDPVTGGMLSMPPAQCMSHAAVPSTGTY